MCIMQVNKRQTTKFCQWLQLQLPTQIDISNHTYDFYNVSPLTLPLSRPATCWHNNIRVKATVQICASCSCRPSYTDGTHPSTITLPYQRCLLHSSKSSYYLATVHLECDKDSNVIKCISTSHYTWSALIYDVADTLPITRCVTRLLNKSKNNGRWTSQLNTMEKSNVLTGVLPVNTTKIKLGNLRLMHLFEQLMQGKTIYTPIINMHGLQLSEYCLHPPL